MAGGDVDGFAAEIRKGARLVAAAALLAGALGADAMAQGQRASGSMAARQPSGGGDTTFIVGGEPTTIEEHPWQVALLIRGARGLQLCGGSMISDTWILTAAHCFAGSSDPVVRVRSGVTDMRDMSTTVSMEKVIVHEGFDLRTFRNDIALVKTRQPMKGAPIQMAAAGSDMREGTPLEVTGWGATAEAGSGSTQLMKAEVPLVSNAECNSEGVYDGKIHGGMICAGKREGGVDACQGDSGGPLVDRSGGAPTLVGVVSWGEGCARERRYGVYTNVALYRQWIKDTLTAEGG